MTKGLTYKDSGVNVDLGDVCSKIMAQACQQTYANRKGRIGEIEVLEKEGLHRIITINFGSYRLMLNSDGIGTKVEFAERTGNHKTMAYDLFAMLADDSMRFGAEPIALSNILDVKKLDEGIIKQLAEGMVGSAKETGVAVVSGEIAELGKRVGGYTENAYNWCGTVLSILGKGKEITGKNIKPGDYLIALPEYGFRSNGISLVRKILTNKFGDEWHKEPVVASLALTPSRIYTKKILKLHGGFGEKSYVELKGVANITGGGIPGKLGRVLGAKKLGAELNDLLYPPEIMKQMQEWGNVSDEEAYKTWNMGNGMIVVVSEKECQKTLDKLGKIGDYSQIVGNVTKKPGIRINSRGHFKEGQTLEFK